MPIDVEGTRNNDFESDGGHGEDAGLVTNVPQPQQGQGRQRLGVPLVFGLGFIGLVICYFAFRPIHDDTAVEEVLSLSEQLTRTNQEVMLALEHAEGRDEKIKHHLRTLDTLYNVLQVKKFNRIVHMKTANKVSCAFNVVEAFFSAMAFGDDINGMIRTCPPPRPPRSEYACQVDSGMLIFWVGNLASKLAAAVSECENTLSVGGGLYGQLPGNDRGPLCASGVGQLAGALGELAGASSMAATTCGNITDDDEYDYDYEHHHRNHFFEGHVSTFGDQTQEYSQWRNLNDERKLLIGEGYIGNDIQCAVDVGLVATNIANMGLAINSAVRSGNCQNKVLPKREALCTVDVGRAVSFFAQIVTFLQFSILNCEDLMNVSLLCGAGISGIGAAAASMAPAVASIVAGCDPPLNIPSMTITSSTITTTSSTATETTSTSSTETRTLSSFDCQSDGNIVPLQLINRPGDNCPDGSDIKQLDISSGTYTPFCAHFQTQCFNACGLNFNDNFIYCSLVGSQQLMRLDCSAGTACFLGSLGSGTFSANFDPETGNYVMTNQDTITTVADVDKLQCLGSPGPVFPNTIRTVIAQPLNKNSVPPIQFADLMVLDMTQFGIAGFPDAATAGKSWVIGCVNGANLGTPPPPFGNRVYIQNIDPAFPSFHYILTMQANFMDITTNLGGLAGAQWQFQNSLYCALSARLETKSAVSRFGHLDGWVMLTICC
eukprot:s3446_g10.t1